MLFRRVSAIATSLLLLASFAVNLVPNAPAHADGQSAGCAAIGGTFSNSSRDLTAVFNAGDTVTLTMTSGGGKSLYVYDYASDTDVAGDEQTIVDAVTSIVWVVPSTGTYHIDYGLGNPDENAESATVVVSCQLAGSTNFARTITVWGVVGIRAVVWQWEDSNGQWWWFYQPDQSTRIQTPIEYRDRPRNGTLVPHYAMSRITTTSPATQNDPNAYRVFDADTLAPLHQIWIELGSEADPSRLAVFVP